MGQTSLRTGISMLGSLKDNPQPFSSCLLCSGSRADACLRSPGIASILTLLIVGSCSLCFCLCFLCAGCAGINCLLISASGSCMFGRLALGCAGAEPLMMFVRAVVTVRPRGLLNLSPACLGRVSTTPGPTEAWFSFAVQEYASVSQKNKS